MRTLYPPLFAVFLNNPGYNKVNIKHKKLVCKTIFAMKADDRNINPSYCKGK